MLVSILRLLVAKIRTYEAVSKLRIGLEVLAMVYHRLAQVSYRQNLLLVFGFVALREGLDVDGHRLLELLHTCERLAHAKSATMLCRCTLVSELHFHLQSFEFFGDIGLGLRAHLLASPLLDPVELLVDIHLCGWLKSGLKWRVYL